MYIYIYTSKSKSKSNLIYLCICIYIYKSKSRSKSKSNLIYLSIYIYIFVNSYTSLTSSRLHHSFKPQTSQTAQPTMAWPQPVSSQHPLRLIQWSPKKVIKQGFWGLGSFIIFIASSISPIITLSVSGALPHSFFHHFTSSHPWHLIHFSSIISFLISPTFHLTSFVFPSFHIIMICWLSSIFSSVVSSLG